MSATIRINKLKIEKTGQTVTVPNEPIKKLMYYLECVFSVISFPEYNKKLTNYQKNYSLSNEEKNKIIELCNIFKPQKLIDSKIFIPDHGFLPDNIANDFFKLTDEKIGVHVNNEIFIGGRIMKTLKIMVFKTNWLNNNYYTPLEKIIENRNKKNENINNYYFKNSTSSTCNFDIYHSSYNNSSSSTHNQKNEKNSKSNVKIIIIISLIILIILILFLILIFTLTKKKNKEKNEEEERCIKYDDSNECLICKDEYILDDDGNCISYSFIALYDVTNIAQSTQLLKYNYDLKSIYKMKIENTIINSTIFYQFNESRIYTVYYYLDKFWCSLLDPFEYMFSQVKTLKEILFNREINNYYIGSMKYMFFMCENLIKIDFNEFYGEKVKYISNLFNGCISLKEINFSKFKPKEIYNMKYTFANCKSLISLNLPNLYNNYSGSMEGVFMNCESLTSLNVLSFTTDHVRNTKSMFEGCKSIVSLNLSHFRTTYVEDMSCMFKNCESLTTLILPYVYGSKIRKWDEMFYFCYSLKYLDVLNIYFDYKKVFNVYADNCTIRAKYKEIVPKWCNVIDE